VLQLLAQHPAERVSRAIDIALARGYREARLIAEQTERLANATLANEKAASRSCHRAGVVPDDGSDRGLSQTSLHHFDQLVSKGEATNE
jgi:hypothetical protein